MSTHRRGATILEATTALLLLGVVAAGMGHTLLATARQQRAAQRQTTAQLEAANLLERVAAMPWSDVTSDRLAGLSISPEAKAALPDAELKFDVTTSEKPPLCKRVGVEVQWQGRTDTPARVRLTTWKYPAEAAAP